MCATTRLRNSVKTNLQDFATPSLRIIAISFCMRFLTTIPHVWFAVLR